MSDPFKGYEPGLTSPPSRGFAITPSDTTDLALVTRGIYLGAGGDLRVLLVGDQMPVTLVDMAGGMVHPLRIRRVYTTGTGASDIVGFV